MMNDFKNLPALTGTPREQEWMRDRLETMSVRERTILAAALARQPPETAADAINSVLSLEQYEVCFPAGDDEQLGKFRLRQEGKMPESAMPYVDFPQLGRQFEEEHPGQFVDNCFVIYPQADIKPRYCGLDTTLPEDNDWSVKVKLASAAVPEGVWLRLPDGSGPPEGGSVEVMLALDALQAESLKECTLLETRCILPEAGNLMEQYDSIAELISDGNNLGFVLDEQGQGEAHWREKFAAALEYEDCRNLRFALDISQNLHCYEYIPCGELESFAEKHLRTEGISEELLQSGCVDLHDYAEDLLETSGYMLARDEGGYVIRNTRKFICEFSSAEQGGMTMQ